MATIFKWYLILNNHQVLFMSRLNDTIKKNSFKTKHGLLHGFIT